MISSVFSADEYSALAFDMSNDSILLILSETSLRYRYKLISRSLSSV